MRRDGNNTHEAGRLRFERVSRIFTMGEVEVPALVGVDLTIEPGEFVVVLGPSGSGKSTLLNLAGGIDRPTAGRVWYGELEISALSDAALTAFRRAEVGFIFQFYNLVPTLNALENVQAACELASDALEPDAALEQVQMSDRAGHFPAQLSGGEQQRVAIARALAKRPRLLLADEPTGALDLASARHVLDLLETLNRRQALTVILITHNSAIARIARRIVRMASGRISEVADNPLPQAAAQIAW